MLRRRDPRRWHGGRLAAFLGGLAAIFLALASPIEPFAGLLLQVHMVQHLLLMMVAPPLLWLGAPLFPLLAGCRGPSASYWVAPLLRSPPLRRLFGRLTHPLTALVLFVAATWLWHVPPLYELALRSSGWHYLQHVCFLGTALLFWYPVVRPYPGRPRWSLWLLFPYLFLADVQNTVLSALLTFSDRVLYPYYAEVPRLAGTLRPGRPGGGGRPHVGAGFAGFSGAAVRHRRPAAVRPGDKRQEPAVRGRRGDQGRKSRDEAAPGADLIARGRILLRTCRPRRPVSSSALTCCASRCWAGS